MTFIHKCLLLLWMGSSLLAAVDDRVEIQKVIIRYNEGLGIAGKSGNVDHLRLFASDKIVNKTYAWIHSWQDSNYYMRAKVQKIDFTEFRIDRNTSSVRTHEEWEYDYFDAAAKKSAMPKTKVIYQMRYTLYPHQGKWFINDIKILNENHTPLEKLSDEKKKK